jgi:hypothetical protein
MTNTEFHFVTDTATLCVFDIKCLEHRLEDDADWWSIPQEELLEVNLGHVGFFGLGQDGRYVVHIVDSQEIEGGLVCHIQVPGGRVFVGAGEEVTSDGMQPKCLRGGRFVELAPGNYAVRVVETEAMVLALAFAKSATGLNSFSEPLLLTRI